jgi:hypothetical protein
MAAEKKYDDLGDDEFFATGEELEYLRKLGREANERLGIFGEPKMTAEELQASQRAHGIRPEDNGASRELMRIRYGDDYEDEE